jgi:DivIVA domain-containing protein
MIDLTPLEVRKKKGDFRKALRGYDPALVDDFLDVVADRLDELVRENVALKDRLNRAEHQVTENRERERALTDALVTAQEMREEMQKQTSREADLMRRAAEQEARQIRAEALQAREREEDVLRRLRARQQQLLQSYRTFLARELAELQVIAETLEVEGILPESHAAPPPNRVHTRETAARESAAREPVPEPVVVAPIAAEERVEEEMVVMGAVEVEPLPEEEPFAPEPVEEWTSPDALDVQPDPPADAYDEITESPLLPQDEAISVLDDDDGEGVDDVGDVDEVVLIDMNAVDLTGGSAPAEVEELLLLEIDDTMAETGTLEDALADATEAFAEPEEEELGAPDHDANALLENALRAGYRLDLEDEAAVDELLLENIDEDEEPPADWLDRMIEDEER